MTRSYDMPKYPYPKRQILHPSKLKEFADEIDEIEESSPDE